MSTFWWLERWVYLKFVLREVSSAFVAWSVVYLLVLVRALAHGEASYQRFLEYSAHPALLVLNLITFLFVLLHAVTWFRLAPQAMVVRLGGQRVPGRWLIAANYVGWAAVSLAVVRLLASG